MKTTYLLFCLTALFVYTTSLTCDCKTKACKPIPCKSGYVKDVCGCCDVCAKTESQQCGGYWGHFGTCADGLSCVIRKKGLVLENVQFSFKPGHCEPKECAKKSCGLYKNCVLLGNKPVCECPRMCKDKGEPVCGLTNGKEYASECHIRKYECKIATKIDFKRGPCKRCMHEGKPYKFNEQIKKSTCEVCTCVHGAWKCKMDVRCMNRSKQTTKPAVAPMIILVNTPCDLSPNGKLQCPSGSSCRPFPGSEKSSMGLCVQDAVVDPMPELTPPEPPATPAEPECLLRKCIPCKYGYIIDSNGCQTCQCKQKRSKSACKLPKFSGPCLANIERFYFNGKIGKCQSFVFGGCLPNGNNFKTRKACEARCML